MDFTLKKYRALLQAFQCKGYQFLTFEQYCKLSNEKRCELDKYVILRHDVDLAPKNSLQTATIEHELGISASYYFRIVPESNQPDVIKKIALLGHEIGYHYEDMALCHGNAEQARKHFEQSLAYFRQFYAVKTICMHGVPRSKFDGKDLWKSADYHDFGIIGEPYFDCDFSQLFYITDTGRRWDGFHVSVRDKIPYFQDLWIQQGLVYHATNQIIAALENETFPKRLMMTTHPQRWTDNIFEWIRELCLQPLKNFIKRMLVKR